LKCYTKDYINKAPNFSLRDFVPKLKKEMKDFEKLKNKNNKNKKNQSFLDKKELTDDFKQTFINKTIGILN